MQCSELGLAERRLVPRIMSVHPCFYLFTGSESIFYALIALSHAFGVCLLPFYLTGREWPSFARSLLVFFLTYPIPLRSTVRESDSPHSLVFIRCADFFLPLRSTERECPSLGRSVS